MCWQWLSARKSYSGLFSSRSEYNNAKALVDKLNGREWFTDFMRMLGDCCKFKDDRVSQIDVATHLNSLVHAFDKFIGSYRAITLNQALR